MHGYARDFSIVDEEAHCQLGFFKDGQPCGKYQKFDLEGNCLEEGIKEGDEMKKEIKIQNYLTQTVKQGVKANYYKGVGGGITNMEARASKVIDSKLNSGSELAALKAEKQKYATGLSKQAHDFEDDFDDDGGDE